MILWILRSRILSLASPLGLGVHWGTEEQPSERVSRLSIEMSTNFFYFVYIKLQSLFSSWTVCWTSGNAQVVPTWRVLFYDFAVFFGPFVSGWYCEGAVNKIEGVEESGKERFREWNQVLLLYTFETWILTTEIGCYSADSTLFPSGVCDFTLHISQNPSYSQLKTGG